MTSDPPKECKLCVCVCVCVGGVKQMTCHVNTSREHLLYHRRTFFGKFVQGGVTPPPFPESA